MDNKLSVDLIKKFYYKDGLSTLEVAKMLGFSEWTVLSFMKKNNLGRRTLKEASQKKFEKKPIDFAPKSKLTLDEEKLKIVGVMLYWAEGANPNPRHRWYTVDFANSDPLMIKLFLKFLRDICRIKEERLRVYLYCYSGQKVEDLKEYWSKITKIPIRQFIKPYVRSNFSGKKVGKMKYGLVHIRYSDKKLLFQIKSWINEYVELNKLGV